LLHQWNDHQKGQKGPETQEFHNNQPYTLLTSNTNEFLWLPEIKESIKKVRAMEKQVKNDIKIHNFFHGPKTIQKHNNSTKHSIYNKSIIVLR
jgi:hypothetical protein